MPARNSETLGNVDNTLGAPTAPWPQTTKSHSVDTWVASAYGVAKANGTMEKSAALRRCAPGLNGQASAADPMLAQTARSSPRDTLSQDLEREPSKLIYGDRRKDPRRNEGISLDTCPGARDQRSWRDVLAGFSC